MRGLSMRNVDDADPKVSAAMERAQEILAGHPADIGSIKDTTRLLKIGGEYALARRILGKVASKLGGNEWLAQQRALCTYKDETLAPYQRYTDALTLLEGIGLRDPAKADAETLRLGGAIYKRRWEREGRLEHLYESLTFYRTAYERDPETDLGYGGVNAAFILDVLAARARTVARRSGIESREEQAFRDQARELRESMARGLPTLIDQRLVSLDESDAEQGYWLPATLAEVYFGLDQFDQARSWLKRARQSSPGEWMLQTTTRQFTAIAKYHGYALPGNRQKTDTWEGPWRALTALLGESTASALDCYRGKIGLALSGGGFRASLFHLGVLARLTDMDALRSVESLSTVSGGSIVGAQYYLELKALLESRPDKQLRTKEPYVEIVRRVIREFTCGVQTNIRTRAVANPIKNLRMIFSKGYSRSHRLGELYEQQLYGRVRDDHPKGQPRTMRDLLAWPPDENQDFKPPLCNWRRSAKVPNLLLNATSLNSGHNWRFTATYMGELASMVAGEVDINRRYEPVRYDAPGLPKDLRDYRLGYAVAASACVPGLFEPLAIEGLYGEDTIIRLVDGGVHDNQGVAALLEDGCTLLLVSDASRQMEDQDAPSDSLIGVPLRANKIMMDRVREAEYQDLKGRVDSKALNGLFFIHFMKDLKAGEVKSGVTAEQRQQDAQVGKIPYGVDGALQAQLAAIRTDLDSFTEVEANALMLSGYLMAEQHFGTLQERHAYDGEPGTWGGFDIAAPRGDWSFLELEPVAALTPDAADAVRNDLGEQARVGSRRILKVWMLYPALRYAAYGLAAIAVIGVVGWLIRGGWNKTLIESISVGGVILIVGGIVIGVIAPWFAGVLKPLETLQGWLRRAGIAVVGSFIALGHLYVFDKLYLRRGAMARLRKKS